MSSKRIDWVAPPFAGHLYPMLHMARVLSDRMAYEMRVLSTASARRAVEDSGLKFIELLPGKDGAVRQIADHPKKVGSKPWEMLAQLKQNLRLMNQLQAELRQLWSLGAENPSLVIADFTLPVAGITAQQLGISWWTGLATPCAMETGGGVPAYLGGWYPASGAFGMARDWLGRAVIRTFKRAVGFVLRKQLKQLGISRIYRADRLESIYSPSCILAYGIEQFEFKKSWPKHVHFIGPWTEPPPSQQIYVQSVSSDRPKILVTLGTHLTWAKSPAIELVQQLAREFPQCEFHFSQGDYSGMEKAGQQLTENLQLIPFVPYDARLSEYRAAIIHGGTGITYACIQAGLPMLVWPHDYDQFDHAARIQHHGLGIWAKSRLNESQAALAKLLIAPSFAQRIREFQGYLQQLDGRAKLEKLLSELDDFATLKTNQT